MPKKIPSGNLISCILRLNDDEDNIHKDLLVELPRSVVTEIKNYGSTSTKRWVPEIIKGTSSKVLKKYRDKIEGYTDNDFDAMKVQVLVPYTVDAESIFKSLDNEKVDLAKEKIEAITSKLSKRELELLRKQFTI